MDKGNWVAMDKRCVAFLPTHRPFTPLEALFSLTTDRDNNKLGSINGYAKLWGWSRTRARRFVRELEAGQDHLVDYHGAGKRHAIRLVFNNLQKDKGHLVDHHVDKVVDTTIDPDPKPNPKEKRQRKRSTTPPLPDEQFFNDLHTNPGYAGIDIERERGKCEAWCKANGRNFSQTTFVNWLNRIEKPTEVHNDKRVFSRRSTATSGRAESRARGFGDGKAYPVDLVVSE